MSPLKIPKLLQLLVELFMPKNCETTRFLLLLSGILEIIFYEYR